MLYLLAARSFFMHPPEVCRASREERKIDIEISTRYRVGIFFSIPLLIHNQLGVGGIFGILIYDQVVRIPYQTKASITRTGYLCNVILFFVLPELYWRTVWQGYGEIDEKSRSVIQRIDVRQETQLIELTQQALFD